MQFHVLGTPEAHRGREAIRLSGRQRALLAVLLADRGTTVSTDRLIDALWHDDPPPSAVASLHSHVSRLRAALRRSGNTDSRGELIGTTPGGYCLQTDGDAVDADVFERLVERAEARLRSSPADAAELFDDALALWRGAAFAGYEHEDFARPEAARLEERKLWAIEERASALLACGREAEALPVLEQMVADHPLREQPRAHLMVALYRTGRHAEALRGYQHYRSTLVEELGLDPSPQLQQIEREILEHSAELAPERRGLSKEPDRQRLPRVRPDSFVGRDHEVAEVTRLLSTARLVTVVGPGGVGKTRLAEHVAQQVAADYPHGALVCDLAPASAGAVVQVLAGAIGARAAADRDLADVVVESLSTKTLLLLIDNCEHVIAEAASVIDQIVAGCLSLQILATSREPLGIPGEHVYRLPPLSTELQPGGSDAPPAVQLFSDRVGAASGGRHPGVDAELALDICRALDGLPLAIELAASRTAVIHPLDVWRRLDERFHVLSAGPGRQQRHRTLKAVVEWSYELLSDPEARLFDRLSVFAGGFTIDAAARVCADESIRDRDVAGLLAQLADRSLIVVDELGPPTRYRLLETLRQYGAEQLLHRGELSHWRTRHLQWCLALAEQAAAGIISPECGKWVRLLNADFGNLRAAHEWARGDGHLDAAFQLSAALERYALQQLHDEVFSWAEQLLDLPDADSQPLFPAVAGIAALGAGIRGDFDSSAHLADRGLAAAAHTDDPRRIVPLNAMADLSLYRGELDDQLVFAAQEGELARRTGDLVHEALAVLHRVLGCAYSGERSRALEHVTRLYDLTEPLAGSSLRAWALYAHGEAILDADPETARDLFGTSIDAARVAEDRFVEGVALVSQTSVAVRYGPEDGALCALATAIQHWQERGDLTHQRVTVRLLVELLDRLGRAEAATVLLAATTRKPMAPPSFDQRDAARMTHLRGTLRKRLGEERFHRAWKRGAALRAHEVAPTALAKVDEARMARQLRP